MRILLVEDDENLSRNLKFFLEREGYQVDATPSISGGKGNRIWSC